MRCSVLLVVGQAQGIVMRSEEGAQEDLEFGLELRFRSPP